MSEETSKYVGRSFSQDAKALHEVADRLSAHAKWLTQGAVSIEASEAYVVTEYGKALAICGTLEDAHRWAEEYLGYAVCVEWDKVSGYWALWEGVPPKHCQHDALIVWRVPAFLGSVREE